MGNLTGRIPTRGKEYTEHDDNENRKRVSTSVDGTTVSYEDSSFVTGDSPVVLDVFTDIGRAGHEGYLINDGPGDMKVEISANGTSYGGLHVLRGGEVFILENLTIRKIRLTWQEDCAYRALVA